MAPELIRGHDYGTKVTSVGSRKKKENSLFCRSTFGPPVFWWWKWLKENRLTWTFRHCVHCFWSPPKAFQSWKIRKRTRRKKKFWRQKKFIRCCVRNWSPTLLQFLENCLEKEVEQRPEAEQVRTTKKEKSFFSNKKKKNLFCSFFFILGCPMFVNLKKLLLLYNGPEKPHKNPTSIHSFVASIKNQKTLHCYLFLQWILVYWTALLSNRPPTIF